MSTLAAAAIEGTGSTSVEVEPSAGEGSNADGKAGVFLSYSREDASFALRLHGALRAQGREVWADWEDIPASTEWETEIAAGIEAADAFVFVLSPDSVASKECGKELTRACEHSKRLFPVLWRDVDPAQAPEAVRSVQWSDLRDKAAFERSFERLSGALDTDFGWMREHTRILQRALEWDRASRDRSRLLRGGDLAEAERWLTQQATSGDRTSTGLQTEYIFASRAAAVRRQRGTVAAVLFAMGVALALAVFALISRSDAINGEKVARSRELAARSALQLRLDPAEGLRLAVAAVNAKSTVEEAERALRRALAVPSVGVVVERQSSPLRAAAFSPDRKLVVTASEDGKTRVRKTATGARVKLLDNRGIEQVDSLSFSRDGRFLLAMGQGLAWVWDTTSWKRIAALDEGNAQAAAFAPDGRLFFSTRGLTRVVDAATGQAVVAFNDPSSQEGDTWAFPPAFSRDGELAVTSSGHIAGAAIVWEVASRHIVAALPGSEDDRVTSAAFSPDGKRIVTSDTGGVARVWAARTGRPISVLEGNSGESGAVFSPDGKLVLTFPGTARLWDPESGKVRHVLGDPRTNGTRAAALDRDGRLVVTAGANGAVQLWDARTGAVVASLRGHTGLVNAAVFSGDGTLIATAADDGTTRLWRVQRLAHLTLPERGPDLSPDRELVVAPNVDGTARVRDVRTGKLIRALSGHAGAVTSARFGADGRLVVTGGIDGTVRVWDAAEWKLTRTLRPRGGPINEATLSRDGTRIVTIGGDGRARLLDAATGHTVAVIAEGIGSSGGADFSPEGTRVLTYGGANNAAEVWDALTGKRVSAVGGGDDEVLAATLGPEGRLLAAGLPAVGASLVDVKTNSRVYGLHGDDVGRSAAFSRDGKLLVTTGESSDARVWDAETGASVAVLHGHASFPVAAAFNPAGTLVATAGSDGTARVWDAREGTPLLVLPNQGYLYSAEFDSGATRIVTAGTEGFVRVYRCDVCGSVEELVAVAGRRLFGRFK